MVIREELIDCTTALAEVPPAKNLKANMPTPAELNEIETRDLVGETKRNFLKLGILLRENKERAFWSVCGHERFSDYVESLGIGSPSWVYRLIEIAEVVVTKRLSAEIVEEVGFSRTCLLLPLLKGDRLDNETLEVARNAPVSELKVHLGYKCRDTNDFVYCPRCGAEIRGVRYT